MSKDVAICHNPIGSVCEPKNQSRQAEPGSGFSPYNPIYGEEKPGSYPEYTGKTGIWQLLTMDVNPWWYWSFTSGFKCLAHLCEACRTNYIWVCACSPIHVPLVETPYCTNSVPVAARGELYYSNVDTHVILQHKQELPILVKTQEGLWVAIQ